MALAIFLFTYLFLAGGSLPGLKLDRPGGALLGATAMVVLGVIAPAEVKDAVDVDTRVLPLGMMLLLAGNLTLVGSIANHIVFEGARDHARVGFWQYFRVGAPATALSLALGLGTLLLEHRFFR